jgi:tetratricopeptide (TPR) repeat protein
MGSSTTSDAEALRLRLERTLEHLVDSDDHRGVVRLVEHWSELGELPIEILRAEAKSLIALCLMDRAWVRLREAAAVAPEDPLTQLLTAEMFVQRGWPARARRVLERVGPAGVDGARLDRLRQAACEPPLQPSEAAQDIERSGELIPVLELAERYMAAGSFVRAQSLLERLHREAQGGKRVADLLWAIQGDLGSGKLSTEALLDQLSPDARLTEWEGIELTDSLQARQETHHDPEAAARELLAASLPREEAMVGFPDLFRNDEVPHDTTLHDEDEVTMASSMATPDQMGGFSPDVHTDPGLGASGEGGDTRIMEVIGQLVLPVDPAKRLHRPSNPMDQAGSELGSTLDLRSYRDSMGVGAGALDGESFLEEEDQDLIVMTRRETRPRGKAATSSAGSVQVVKRMRESSGLGGVSSEVTQPADHDVTEPEGMAASRLPRPRRGLQMTAWVAVLGLGLVVVGGVILYGLRRVAGRQVIEDTHAIIVAGHFRSIQELEAKLDSEVKAEREPLEVRRIELALVRVVLWAEYTGDSDRLASAEGVLQLARGGGVGPNELVLARGYLALTRGDLVTAQAEVDGLVQEDSLSRVLTARVALARGQPTALEAAWIRVGGEEALRGSLLEVLSLEALASKLGEDQTVAAARELLLTEHGDNALVQLARFEAEWSSDLGPSEALVALAEAKAGLPGALSPRQAGRFHMLRSQLTEAIGMSALAKAAWRSALLEDPNHPRYLYQAAVEAVRQNRLVAAEDDLRRCLRARPWDQACRRGTVQVLVDLDRLETARALVEGFRGPGVDVEALAAWIELSEGRPQDALDTLGARGRVGPVGAYVEAMARADLDVSQADAGLVAAADALKGSADLLDTVLAARAETGRMRFVSKMQQRQIEAQVVLLAPTDPGVQMLIGEYWEGRGRRGEASDAFDLAARLGVENARAHYARGLFYFDPRGDMAQARSAWARYLALQPNGPRAARIVERMRPR